MKRTPLGGRVIVEALKPPTQSAGGILLPDSAQNTARRGKVLAVGGGTWNDDGLSRRPVELAVGDIVVFPEYAGVVLDDTDPLQVVLTEAEILAVEHRAG
jgi:chaperonin GroES